MMLFEESVLTPVRIGLDERELWRQEDKGLINAWEIGRELAIKEPEMSLKAKRGELPELMFKGGFKERLKGAVLKYGALHYLAMWKGLREENLSLSLDYETALICSKTGMGVLFTFNSSKYLLPDMTKIDQGVLGEDFCNKAKKITLI